VSFPTRREGALPRPVRQAPFEPKPGLLVAGKYRVEKVIGEGGMGVVVAATHEGLDQRVAIKFLAPDAMRSAEATERFLREAKVAAKVKSDHVARVSDVGRVESGTPFIVMEHLEGLDLAGMVKQAGALPIDEVCEIGLQACEALAEVHAAGIVHRDLKPSNLFITRRADGSPYLKLLDFGISKLTAVDDDGVDPALTATATIMGSPSYMSPEQLKSTREVDARTDVWSLGVVIYEALTGKRAFRGESMVQVCAMIASEEPVVPSSLRPDVPLELEQAVLACLVKRPQERGTLLALARVLVRFAPDRARASLERVEAVLGAERSQKSLPAVVEKPVEVARTQQSWGTDSGRKRRRGGGGAFAVLAIVAVGVLVAGVYTGRIDLKSLTGQVASATSAVASALPAPSNVPPLASVVAPLASALASAASAMAPPASSTAPIASAEDPDASDDGDDDDDEPSTAASSASSGVAAVPAWRPPTSPHLAQPQPKHAPVRPRHGKGTHKHH
jgi:serine/threonine protein kinase